MWIVLNLLCVRHVYASSLSLAGRAKARAAGRAVERAHHAVGQRDQKELACGDHQVESDEMELAKAMVWVPQKDIKVAGRVAV